jgi:hypothetical protein
MVNISPSTKIKLGLTKTEIKYIAGHYNLTYEEILAVIQDILVDTLTFTTRELEDWINSKVPKRTGNLREDLISNLYSSRVQQGILRLILGSTIEYAKFVNAMTTTQVAHGGEWGYAYYHGYYGKIWLNDPEAIGHFFRELLFYAKERIQLNLREAKLRHLGFGRFSTKIKRMLG